MLCYQTVQCKYHCHIRYRYHEMMRMERGGQQSVYVHFLLWIYPRCIIGLYFPLQKWSKGKVRDKLNNLALLDKATYDKLYKEVPNYKLITPSVVSERLKVRVSLANRVLSEMASKGTIREVFKHHAQRVYTRAPKGEETQTVCVYVDTTLMLFMFLAKVVMQLFEKYRWAVVTNEHMVC